MSGREKASKRDKFRIKIFGAHPVVREIIDRLPCDEYLQIENPAEQAAGDISPDADVLLAAVAPSKLTSVLIWAQENLEGMNNSSAAISLNLPVSAVVRLIRSGFGEVFELNQEMEQLSQWVIQRYEQRVKQATKEKGEKVSQHRKTVIIGESEGMKRIRKLGEMSARISDMTVLIQGETGTGKELVARYIHEQSDRAEGPFVEVNCSAIAETLLESEMMGFEKGAFTDARRRKKGFFELASGGTLFLDEIGFMSLNLQSKILKILEEKKFRRIGGEKEISVDVKVVAGTNIDLKRATVKNEFRADLYYRLKVFNIHIPPLRERGADIEKLAQYFLKRARKRYSLPVAGFHPGTLEVFKEYEWPGNVRELKHAVERGAVLANEGRILPTHLPEEIQRATPVESVAVMNRRKQEGGSNEKALHLPLPEEGMALEDMEQMIVKKVLDICEGNQSRAARYLRISRSRLLRKLAAVRDRKG